MIAAVQHAIMSRRRMIAPVRRAIGPVRQTIAPERPKNALSPPAIAARAALDRDLDVAYAGLGLAV